MAATWLLIFNWIQSIEIVPSFSKCNKFPAHPRISIVLHILVTAALQYLKKERETFLKKRKIQNVSKIITGQERTPPGWEKRILNALSVGNIAYYA